MLRGWWRWTEIPRVCLMHRVHHSAHLSHEPSRPTGVPHDQAQPHFQSPRHPDYLCRFAKRILAVHLELAVQYGLYEVPNDEEPVGGVLRCGTPDVD
eukprot:3416190-Amphidinium_carterae.1